MLSFDQLLEAIAGLLESGTIVSFYDAHRLIRAAKGLGEPRSAVVYGLVALHDENATDGAKRIIAEYLRSAGGRLRSQEALAERTIVLKDTGKIARTPPGSSLNLALEEKRAAGLAWSLQRSSGPVNIERQPNVDEVAPRARFSIQLPTPGRVELIFLEREPEGSMYSHAASRRPTYEHRTMTLTIIVEL